MVKLPKDPNAPTRPMTAFILWAGEARKEIASEHPDYSITEIAKVLGKKWKKVDEDEKGPFVEKADKLKAKYQSARARYIKSSEYAAHQEVLKEWKKKQARKPFPKDPNAPKRPMSSYMFYVNEQRPEVIEEFPNLKFTDIVCLIGKRWNQLSSSDKEAYVDMASEAKAGYKKALTKYEGSSKHTKYQKEKAEYQAKQKEAKTKLAKKAMKPKKKKKASRSASRASSRSRSRRRAARRRSVTPKSAKRRSRSATKRRATKRRAAKTPKAPKRSSASSTSRSRSRSSARSASRSSSRRVSRKRRKASRSPKSPKRRARKRRTVA